MNLGSIPGQTPNIPPNPQGTGPQDTTQKVQQPQGQTVGSPGSLQGQQAVTTQTLPTTIDTSPKISSTTGKSILVDSSLGSEAGSEVASGLSLDPSKPIPFPPVLPKENIVDLQKQASQIISRAMANTPDLDKIMRIASTPNPRTQNIKETVTQKLIAIKTADPKQQYLLVIALMAQCTNELQMNLSQRDLVRENTTFTNQQKYFNAIAQRQAAQERMKHANIFQKFFMWLGAILAVIAAAILKVLADVATVATFGAAAPAAAGATMLLISACMSLGVMILQESGAMDAIANKIIAPLLEKMFGLSKEAAQMAAGIILTVMVVVAQIALMVASGGAGAMNVGQEVGESVRSTMALMDTIQTMVGNINTVSQGITMTGQAVSGAASSVSGYQQGLADVQLTQIQQDTSNMELSKDQLQKLLQALEKLKQDMYKSMSTVISLDIQAMSAILGRLGKS